MTHLNAGVNRADVQQEPTLSAGDHSQTGSLLAAGHKCMYISKGGKAMTCLPKKRLMSDVEVELTRLECVG